MILTLILVLAQSKSPLGAHPRHVVSGKTGISMLCPNSWKVAVSKPVQRPADGTMEMDDADKPPKDTLLLRLEKGKMVSAELRRSPFADYMLKRSQENDQLSWQHPKPLGSFPLKFADGYTPVMVGKQKGCVQMWENKEGDDTFMDVVQVDVQEPSGKIYRFLGKATHNGVMKGRVVDNTDGVLMPHSPIPEMAANLPIFEAMLRSIKMSKR